MKIRNKFLQVVAEIEEPTYHTIIYFSAIEHDNKLYDLTGEQIQTSDYQKPIMSVDELHPAEKIQLLTEYRKLVQEVEHLRKDAE